MTTLDKTKFIDVLIKRMNKIMNKQVGSSRHAQFTNFQVENELVFACFEVQERCLDLHKHVEKACIILKHSLDFILKHSLDFDFLHAYVKDCNILDEGHVADILLDKLMTCDMCMLSGYVTSMFDDSNVLFHSRDTLESVLIEHDLYVKS